MKEVAEPIKEVAEPMKEVAEKACSPRVLHGRATEHSKPKLGEAQTSCGSKPQLGEAQPSCGSKPKLGEAQTSCGFYCGVLLTKSGTLRPNPQSLTEASAESTPKRSTVVVFRICALPCNGVLEACYAL